MCRTRNPMMYFSAPPLEKSSIHFGRKSKNSDLAVSISRNFSKADTQDLIASGRVVPVSDVQTIVVFHYKTV